MANLIEVNDQIEAAYMLDVIDDEEFALLREINRPQRALVIPYWQYEKFDLETYRMTNAEQNLDLRKDTFMSLNMC